MEELTRACRGVHNFLTTPFLPDGALDVEGLRGKRGLPTPTGTPGT